MSDGKSFGLFLLLTFSLTWGLAAFYLLAPEIAGGLFGPLGMTNPLFLLAVYSPGIAGCLVVALGTGLAGLGRFFNRLLLVRAPGGWYFFLLVGVPVLMGLGAAVAGNPLQPAFDGLVPLLSAMALMLVVGPVEEFGWRGVALPLLQRRMTPLAAALVLGLIWGIWHLPAFLIGGTPQSQWDFLPYFAAVVAVSVIMTGLFNASRGSLLLAMLMHFQLNNPLWPDAQPFDSLVFGLAAVLVFYLGRRTSFSRERAVTGLLGENAAGEAHQGGS